MSMFFDYELRDAAHAFKLSPKTANRLIHWMEDARKAKLENESVELNKTIIELLKNQSKIAAIKHTREVKGWGLMEAKDYVLALAAKHGVYPS